MWPGSIEVLNVGVQHAVELLLMQDKQIIETFAPHTQEKPFTDGIRSRGLIRCGEHCASTCVRNPRETGPKLAIDVPEKLFRFLSKRRGFTQRDALPKRRSQIE
jgi:hypothetical protein